MTDNGTVDLRADGLLAASGQEAEFTYCNWRGKVGRRRVGPVALWYGSTQWHTEVQWLLRAIDVERDVSRDFAVVDIAPDSSPSDDALVDLRTTGLLVAAGQEAEFLYRGREGAKGRRVRSRPVALWYGATRWHPQDQWLLRAIDLDRGLLPRDFALADIVPDEGVGKTPVA